MIDNYGMVPLTDYLGLGIVLFSYAGTLCWGFNADWDLVPDLASFGAATEASFRELREAAEGAEPAPLRPAAMPRRRNTVVVPVEQS